MAIPDIRKQLANCVESLSAISDTLYDEVKAPHWEKKKDSSVEEIIENAEEVREDPETWADQDMEDSFGKDDEESEEGGEDSTDGEEANDEEETDE